MLKTLEQKCQFAIVFVHRKQTNKSLLSTGVTPPPRLARLLSVELQFYARTLFSRTVNVRSTADRSQFRLTHDIKK